MQNFALSKCGNEASFIWKKTSAINAVQLNVVHGILIRTKVEKCGRVSILRTDFFVALLPENQICMSSRFFRNKNCKNNLQSFTKSSPRLADQVLFRSQGKIQKRICNNRVKFSVRSLQCSERPYLLISRLDHETQCTSRNVESNSINQLPTLYLMTMLLFPWS